MDATHAGYRFGDVTRMLIHWLGPHALAIRGKIDWLKFAKAIVMALIAGQTVDLAYVGSTLVDAVTDPTWSQYLSKYMPMAVTAIVYVLEQARRIHQDGKDAKPLVLPGKTSDAAKQEARDLWREDRDHAQG